MSGQSGIEWTDATWNPFVGCTAVSPGCDNCYAAREASGRLAHTPAYAGLAAGGRFNGHVRLLEDRLEQPRHWRNPRRVFVNSMSDLFHESVPDEYIARIWQVMATTPQHTYQILTKRHARMRAWVNRCGTSPGGWITHDRTDPARACDGTGVIVGYRYHPPVVRYHQRGPLAGQRYPDPKPTVAYGWPLPNVWLGVSVEDNKRRYRIEALLNTPAAVRFLSCEPLIGPLSLTEECGLTMAAEERGQVDKVGYPIDGLDWVIVGGESGPNARPMHPDWARQLRDECQAARVPFFFKQWGEWIGGTTIAYDDGAAFFPASDPGSNASVWDWPGDDDPHTHHWADGRSALRVGKHAAGRTLDGRVWDEYPAGVAS